MANLNSQETPCHSCQCIHHLRGSSHNIRASQSQHAITASSPSFCPTTGPGSIISVPELANKLAVSPPLVPLDGVSLPPLHHFLSPSSISTLRPFGVPSFNTLASNQTQPLVMADSTIMTLTNMLPFSPSTFPQVLSTLLPVQYNVLGSVSLLRTSPQSRNHLF
ncbi:hypothetical protein L873DRAFT_65487 [Choiromyces venosus 120613-1]|uniref:Uncharacterized protein n=1 Tax=Choiromyces venosus 120613-1 TaxID=1336337 RepID=A0A3N4J4V2_9PEZI|nr:hypothetical protein L873DRAFT_65487 [Choiromyces venosus 120613-1]